MNATTGINLLTGATIGAAVGALIAWLSCGTISYWMDPEPEMVHPFYFAANMWAVVGAPIGLVFGLIIVLCREHNPPVDDSRQKNARKESLGLRAIGSGNRQQ